MNGCQEVPLIVNPRDYESKLVEYGVYQGVFRSDRVKDPRQSSVK